MPRVNCPACDAQISTEAESCPQCAHPMRVPAGSTCYACLAPATTVCPRCGGFSCPQHLESVKHYRHLVPMDRGVELAGEYREFLCEPCYSAEIKMRGKEFAKALGIVAAICAALILFIGILVAIYGWPGWP